MNNIKKFIETPSGKELKQFLLGHYLKLKNIDNVEDLKTDKAQALAFKANKKAAKILEEILSEIMDMSVEATPKKLEDQFYNL